MHFIKQLALRHPIMATALTAVGVVSLWEKAKGSTTKPSTQQSVHEQPPLTSDASDKADAFEAASTLSNHLTNILIGK
jgi:hypothetical protein